MSLGGIAIAIGAMIDAAIVMIENMHKHLERAIAAKGGGRDRPPSTIGASMRRSAGSGRESAREVGPALFFSLLIITVSFVPCSRCRGRRDALHAARLHQDVRDGRGEPAVRDARRRGDGLLIRGRIVRESANPINRWLVRLYRPVIALVLRHRWATIGGAVL
jgi:Cu(I)/Ag(I) efflux system membrane protein CusA/SilA